MKSHFVWGMAAAFVGAVVAFVIVWSVFATVVLTGEPTEKADDTFYDRGLGNMMRLAGLPDEEIKYLMSLPTSPEVDLDSIALQDTTRWFFVSPELDVGIVFEINGQCKVPGFKVYDLRGRKGK